MPLAVLPIALLHSVARRARRLAACSRGTSAVEFALLSPLLLTLMSGIICFGWYFSLVHGVQQLAAEAARASVAGLSDAERIQLAQASVTTNATWYPFITPSRLSVGATATDPQTSVFTITLTYDASDVPIFSMPFVPMPSSTITRSAAVQRGGY